MDEILDLIIKMKGFLYSKVGAVPTFVEIIMWDDNDFEVSVKHTGEPCQYVVHYHKGKDRAEFYTIDKKYLLLTPHREGLLYPFFTNQILGRNEDDADLYKMSQASLEKDWSSSVWDQ